MKRLPILLVVLASCGKAEPPGPPPSAGPALQSRPCPMGGEMVLIPAGEFTMGHASGRPDETPHAVKVNAFWIERTAVTQELYQRVMGVNPSKRKDSKGPVERIQWTDAAKFCNKCSVMEGLKPCYDPKTWACDFEAEGYRLPTEAEWEYACRAGSKSKYFFGDDESGLPQVSWTRKNSEGRTHPVGRKASNAWGLYDMHGNVWQWCNDWYDEGYNVSSSKEDPRGPASGKQRVLRGGAWDSNPDKCTASYRHKEFPVYTDACFGTDSNGFRRARNGKANPAAVGPPAPAAATDPKKEEPPSPARASTQERQAAKKDLSWLKGTIVFVSDRGGSLDLWRTHASGKNLKQLTKDAPPDADPKFSPDGKKILYTTLRGGFPEVWMMNRDGSDPKHVTKGSQGAWSPDGQSIVFIRDNQAWVRELGSGAEKRITPEAWERCGVPAWAPGGKHIAVASRHEESIGIYILSLDGKENFKLKTQEACCTPAWAKDGKRLLLQTVKGHIHQVEIDGKNWEQVTFGADIQHDGRYAPDETMFVYCRAPVAEGPWQICVKKFDSDDFDFVQITNEGSNSLPDWHPSED